MNDNNKNSMKDSMSPPPSVESSQETFYPSVPRDVENILSQLVNLNNDNILHEPTCIICSSIYRKDIEDMWFAIKKHEDVKEAFKDKIELSNDVIDNHIRNHYDKGIKELQKIEYITNVKVIEGSSSIEI